MTPPQDDRCTADAGLALHSQRRTGGRQAVLGLLVAAPVLLAWVAGGCGIGPPLLNRDRLGYQEALSESWKRQMLMNLVKIRYADAPVFLEVTSVINQHSLEAQLSALGVLNNPPWSHRQEYRGGITAYDRPTVTYVPMAGEKFAKSLMTPIPTTVILSMVQSGWPVDFILRLTCDSVNGVRNGTRSALNRRPADPEFGELLAAMRRIQLSDTIGFRVEREKDHEVAKVFFGRHKPTPDVERDLTRIREILGVEPGARELRLTYGAVAAGQNELDILSRSMLQILVELGGCIDVPKDHVERGLVVPAGDDEGSPPLIRIHSGRQAPSDTAAAVRYKGYWFWVADGDFASKRMLSLLMIFFSLTETGGGIGAPVITVGAG